MFFFLKRKVPNPVPKDVEQEFLPIFNQCAPYTMTSPERMYALYKAAIYIHENAIEGDVVECGVWRGGSSMIPALTLKSLYDTKRRIFLYDTYKGMNRPGDKEPEHVHKKWKGAEKESHNDWCYAPLEEVKKNMISTGYPGDKISYIEGEVEKTIPQSIPEKIAILRLDTDWYESTYHELQHLFPLLSVGGVLIIDDYGHHRGAREAVDKYFKENNIHPYLARIDGTCRLYIKK